MFAVSRGTAPGKFLPPRVEAASSSSVVVPAVGVTRLVRVLRVAWAVVAHVG
ncbi:hypothetical protein GCM10017744_080310 [Streptomyces antimycoticus]